MKPEYATATTSYASCRWCGIVAGSVPHTIEACPSVKAVEYHPDGSISRVEKWGPADRQAPVIPLWWFSTHLEAMSQYPVVPAHNPYASQGLSRDDAGSVDEQISNPTDNPNDLSQTCAPAHDSAQEATQEHSQEGSQEDQEDSQEEDSREHNEVAQYSECTPAHDDAATAYQAPSGTNVNTASSSLDPDSRTVVAAEEHSVPAPASTPQKQEAVGEVQDSQHGTAASSPREPREPGPVTFAQVPAPDGLDAVVLKRSDYVAPPNGSAPTA